MTMNINDLVQKLEPGVVERRVTGPARRARETFSSAPSATDHRDFKAIVTKYVQHHNRVTAENALSDVEAFGRAKEILDATFPSAGIRKGYEAALMRGLHDGLATVLDHLSQAITDQALTNYVDNLYASAVDPFSKQDVQELATALNARYTRADLQQNPALRCLYNHLPPILREL